MPRPGKNRRICRVPRFSTFYTDGKQNNTTYIQMNLEEYETIRLIDYQGMTQEECAAQMNVGRATVQAIYATARKKLARFLTEGNSLQISGGCYEICSGPCRNSCGQHGKIKKEEGDLNMKIAVTYENGQVFQHFGHSEQFKIYEVSNGIITASEVVDTNGSGHGALAGFLQEHGVSVLICGGIGGGAKNALAECGIELFAGAVGDADVQVNSYLAGTLSYDPDTICSHHDHEHGEGGHDCGSHGSEAHHECGHHCS